MVTRSDDLDGLTGSYELSQLPSSEPFRPGPEAANLSTATFRTGQEPNLSQRAFRSLLKFWKHNKLTNPNAKRSVPLRPDGVDAGLLVDEQTGYPYVSNRIRTAKYTLWTFLPRQIVYQFSRMANAYFLVIGILQMIPGFSTTGRFTTIIPLLIFVAITMAKEGYDDYQRYRLDKEEDSRTVTVWRGEIHQMTMEKRSAASVTSVSEVPLAKAEAGEKEWKNIAWGNLAVGDVVRLTKDELIPADMVILHADHDLAYVDTRALDGETNLKNKTVSPALKDLGLDTPSISAAVAASDVVFTYELPNQDLYNFDGSVNVNGEPTMPLNVDNVIYRGCELKNTRFIIGLVLNTGEDTKIRMNANKNPSTKRPVLEKFVDLVVISLAIYMLTTSFLLYMGFKLYWDSSDLPWYLLYGNTEDAPVIIGFIIQFSDVIPMSLIMAIEAVKLNLGFWIAWDIEMYHEETDCPAGANTSNILDDLGQIGYVFTDKTGTLTDNIMKFRRLCVAGTSWWHRDQRSTAEENEAPTPGDSTTEDLVARIRQDPDSALSRAASEYLLALAVCHTCLPEYDAHGNIADFQASSPDELALVRAAQELGILVAERSTATLTLQISATLGGKGRKETYDVLDVVEFSSKRKRMSIIVRRPDGRLWLVCKGADSVLLPLLRISEQKRQTQSSTWHERSFTRSSVHGGGIRSRDINSGPFANESPEVDVGTPVAAWTDRDAVPGLSEAYGKPNEAAILQQCCEYIDSYAREGLRTLVLAERYLSEPDYQSWKRRYRDAQVSLTDRQQKLEEIGQEIEHGLDLIGATGVEDKLQKGVPETIDKLRRAGIKIWMLTGDKRETAINIAHSSHICTPNTTLFQVDVEDGDLERQMTDIIKSPEHKEATHTALVIDGTTLLAIEAPGAHQIRSLFYLQLIPLMHSVICSRASPSQKALLVQAVRDGAHPSPPAGASIITRTRGWWRSATTNHLQPLTLAIGDGANDLAMIAAANVGVGISGREGQQAARVADVSIAQFRFLARLLLVHGRWNYHRITRFVLASFWKEAMFRFPMALYQIGAGFTGTAPFESSALTVYGILFTIGATMALGAWERDLKARTLMAVPELYAYGQKAMGLNWGVFFAWMGNAILAGSAIALIAWAGYGGVYPLTPDDNGIYAVGTLVFIACAIWVNVKLLIIEMQSKTILVLGLFAIQSMVLIWLFHIGLGYIRTSLVISPYSVVDGFTLTFGRDLAWWATLVLIFGALLVVELSVETLRQRYSSVLTRLSGREKREWDPRLWKEIERDPVCKRRLEEMACD